MFDPLLKKQENITKPFAFILLSITFSVIPSLLSYIIYGLLLLIVNIIYNHTTFR
jgi:type III secretory pathway component EscU